jgi:hypothetical protein
MNIFQGGGLEDKVWEHLYFHIQNLLHWFLPVEIDRIYDVKSENQHHSLQLNLLQKFVSGTSILYIKLRKM